MKIWLKALLASALLATPVAAQELVTLDPATDWGLVSDDASCAMRRDFKAGDDKVSLEIRQFGPGNLVQFTLVSRDFSASPGEVRIDIQPVSGGPEELKGYPVETRSGAEGKLFLVNLLDDAPELRQARENFAQSMSGLSPDERALLVRILHPDPAETLTEEDLSKGREMSARFNAAFSASGEFFPLRDRLERAIGAVELTNVFWEPMRLNIGPLDAVMNDLRGCIDGKLPGWGVDPVAYRTQLRAPVIHLEGSLAGVFPSPMARRGKESIIHLRIDVSEEGEPMRCNVGANVFNDFFKLAACRALMRQFRFDPALDAQGHPMASIYYTVFQFGVR